MIMIIHCNTNYIYYHHYDDRLIIILCFKINHNRNHNGYD